MSSDIEYIVKVPYETEVLRFLAIAFFILPWMALIVNLMVLVATVDDD